MTVRRRTLGRSVRFAILVIFTLVVLLPLGTVVVLSLEPRFGSHNAGLSLATIIYVIADTNAPIWLKNSSVAAVLTTIAAVAVACPAGYVLSRARGKAMSGYSLGLFIVQAFPTVVFVVPLFILFADLGLTDSIRGLVVVYVAATTSVACWVMRAYIDTIPVMLEESAWIDGCSVFGSFWRIVLPNAMPGILSAGIFSFLVAWNDYLIALVFLRTTSNYTLGVGIQTFFEANYTDWAPVMAMGVLLMIPPIIVFGVFHRYFGIGGIGGAISGG